MQTDARLVTTDRPQRCGVHQSWSARRHWVWALVTCVLAATLAVGYRSIVLAQDPFHLQDWVISYVAGFVRRGFTGEFVFWVSSWASLPPSWGVLLLQAAAYGAFLHGVAVLVLNGPRSWAVLFAAVSPALVLFHLHDTAGGFRKEVLGLALVAQVLARSVRAGSDGARFRVMVVGLLVAVPTVLSHELNVVMLPVLLPLALGVRWNRRRTLVVGGALSAVAAALLLTLTHPGSTAQEAGICAHLRTTLPPSGHLDVCGEFGAVSWLSVTAAQAFDAVLAYAGRHGDGLLLVLPLTAGGLVPLGVEARAAADYRRWRWGVAGVATSVVALVCGASVALDWGRLVYVGAVLAFVSLLHLRATPAVPGDAMLPVVRWRWLPWLAPVYAMAWNLNHSNDLFGLGLLRLLVGQ